MSRIQRVLGVQGVGTICPYAGISLGTLSQRLRTLERICKVSVGLRRPGAAVQTPNGPDPLIGALFALFLVPAVGGAQEAPALRAQHFTIGVGFVSSGAYDVGTAAAELRGNGPGASAPPFTLFTTDSRVSSATAPELRVGFALSPRFAAEFGFARTQPHVGVGIAGDPEAPAQHLLGEELQQYTFEGGATWQLPFSAAGKFAPFVSGGAAFLRQLHEDRTLAESGEIYHAGVGARYWLRGGRGPTRALGVRGDARINFRRNGIDFEDKMRSYPSFSLSLFLGL